jgi:hypothetical protein
MSCIVPSVNGQCLGQAPLRAGPALREEKIIKSAAVAQGTQSFARSGPVAFTLFLTSQGSRLLLSVLTRRKQQTVP